jgi:hypothetical protein
MERARQGRALSSHQQSHDVPSHAHDPNPDLNCPRVTSSSPSLNCMSAETPGEPADVARKAVVIRFRPIKPDAVWEWACKEHRRTGRHRLSVFADIRRGQETEQDVIDRLLKASELAGIDPAKNKKYSLCTSAAELLDLGFTFWRDGDDDERDEHYSVDLGTDATLEDAVRFLSVFRPAEERR